MTNRRFIVTERLKVKRTKAVGFFSVRFVGGTFLQKIGGELHYLGCHAPAPIRLRWKGAWDSFLKHHMKPYKMVCLGIVREVI